MEASELALEVDQFRIHGALLLLLFLKGAARFAMGRFRFRMLIDHGSENKGAVIKVWRHLHHIGYQIFEALSRLGVVPERALWMGVDDSLLK